MNFISLFTTSLALVPFAMAVPAQNEITIAGSSCQIKGGDKIANQACKNTCQEQGPEWTGGYCDNKQICHCTFGDM
ncbi:hypothetical protein BO70DRAFT_396705 [Aspergillus terreus]|uniref:Uncharacterized protein n=1 Tax=Aspergillus terreus TaxID=33178 RepID=A0A5M3YUQ7_ASPTE|nr:hypothetical protein ATETN484_0003010600 [Aspergillus terreus]GFF14114.1 hypothetical protein BO70DRAFT_396705 [Aspergillus terreus]